MIARFIAMFIALFSSVPTIAGAAEKSVARLWNEELLWAIRLDSARPTVHARNLFHVSAAMWDAWAAYDTTARGVFYTDKHPNTAGQSIDAARRAAVSYAAYRLIQWRFRRSPNVIQMQTTTGRLMATLGYDPAVQSTEGNDPAAIGNRIAQTIIEQTMQDGANEAANYANLHYQPVNPRLSPDALGNATMVDPNRWQQLDIPNFVGQSGERSENYPPFVGPEWGNVTPFSLTPEDRVVRQRQGQRYWVYLDSGPPPQLGRSNRENELYRREFSRVIEYSGQLDADDGIIIDISPASRGNNALGENTGTGYSQNPVTGRPYAPHWVFAGDYYRAIAEYWADGPSSETPPGHWYVLLNFVSAQIPAHTLTFAGDHAVLDKLAWDVRAYLALGGAMHDAAIAAWSHKGWYDYPRPISAIRYLCDKGQSNEPGLPDFHPHGIALQPGLIERTTLASLSESGRHSEIGARHPGAVGQIAIRAWRGPKMRLDANTEKSGVGWILCGAWWPYQ